MLTSEALPVIGVPPVPIGAMRSKGVSARAPSPFDGIPPPTLKTAPSLAAFLRVYPKGYNLRRYKIFYTLYGVV